MVFQLRDALKVGSIQLSTHFFSLKLGVNEALKVVRSELTNFAIVVEPPKTTFGKVRKTCALLRDPLLPRTPASERTRLRAAQTPARFKANRMTSRSPSSSPSRGCGARNQHPTHASNF